MPCVDPGCSYTVAKGDTLAAIAQSKGTDLSSILALNKGLDPTKLYVDQVCYPQLNLPHKCSAPPRPTAQLPMQGAALQRGRRAALRASVFLSSNLCCRGCPALFAQQVKRERLIAHACRSWPCPAMGPTALPQATAPLPAALSPSKRVRRAGGALRRAALAAWFPSKGSARRANHRSCGTPFLSLPPPSLTALLHRPAQASPWLRSPRPGGSRWLSWTSSTPGWTPRSCRWTR